MTEQQGTFTVPTRLFLSPEHRARLERMVREQETDLAPCPRHARCAQHFGASRSLASSSAAPRCAVSSCARATDKDARICESSSFAST